MLFQYVIIISLFTPLLPHCCLILTPSMPHRFTTNPNRYTPLQLQQFVLVDLTDGRIWYVVLCTPFNIPAHKAQKKNRKNHNKTKTPQTFAP